MSYESIVLADSPVGYWQLGESSGTTAADSSTGGNNGTYTPNALGLWTGGTLGQTGIPGGGMAATFDGISGYVNFGNVLQFDGNIAFSIEAWLKYTAAAPGNILSKQNNVNFEGFGFGLSGSGAYEFFIYNGTAIIVDAAALNNDGNFHHVVWTYSGSGNATGVILYVDGSPASTVTILNNLSGSVASSASMQINGRGGSNSLVGMTATEAAIYSAVLTSTQVLAHYNTGITPPSGTLFRRTLTNRAGSRASA